MDAAVVGGIVGGATQVAVEKLLSLISLYFDQEDDFHADLKKLESNLKWSQAVLDDAWTYHITTTTSRVVKLWVRELQEASDEAYHALDEFHYHILREKRNSIDTQPMGLMNEFKSVFSDDPRKILYQKIKENNDKLDSFRNRGADDLQIHQMIIGLSICTLRVGAATFASPETDSFTMDPVFIEREKDVSKIVEMLANIRTEGELSILPIVGMGGLGKTTLARHVYHHGWVGSHFPTRIWVHVSTTFDPITIFKKILTNLTSEKVEVENKEVVLGKLQRALADKTFLLVLDDMWNHDQRIWEDVINALSRICSTKGNGIIVTTRNSEVGTLVGTLHIYELQGLSKEGCWSIIKEKSIGKREMPLDFQILGRSIAKRCQGLPLAANVVGGLLCGKSKDDWVLIEQNWLSDFDGDENNISKILKLSFHHLPSPSLKKCFAYCSIFGKGGHIWKDELIELWMAEGFLQSSDMENVGDKYFNLLLQNSLLQVVDRGDHENDEYYGMHDLVHDLAVSVSKDFDNARYIHWKCSGDTSRRIPKEKAKWCHGLSYEGAISDITFSNFKSLHSLTLINYDIKELPDSIRELIHLRYLNIIHTSIEHLPNSIGELYHLQTFRGCAFHLINSPVLKVPSTLKYLFNMRHLHASCDTKLPNVGMLTSLKTLAHFKVCDEDGYRIVELESLSSLQGALQILNLEEVQAAEESKKANLSQKSGIIRLALRWIRCKEESIVGEINDEDVLKCLQPHPNLKMLEISGFRGASFPLWTLKMAVCLEGHWVGLNNLTVITLADCEECEEIPTLGHLPCLKTLVLRDLRNVKIIGSSFYGIDSCRSNNGIYKETINVFPVLENLNLCVMPNLREWAEVEISSSGETHEAREVKIFPCLKYLNIMGCNTTRNTSFSI